jgi:hypothetical protein
MAGITANASASAPFLGSSHLRLAEDALLQAMVALAPGLDRPVARAVMGRYIIRRVERGETNETVLRAGALADLRWKTAQASIG